MWTSLLPTYIIIIFILTVIMVILGRTISPAKPDLGKVAPYECGFDPINSPRLPFSFRFFLVAILFLIFDLEIALLLVIPVSNSVSSPSNSILLISCFMLILAMGLYYEWVNGGLDWAED